MKTHFILLLIACLSLTAFLSYGQPAETAVPVSLEIATVPPAAAGGPDKMDTIAGRLNGSCADCKVILFAKGGDTWFVQPWTAAPRTTIQDGLWKNQTHLGSEYSAVLVRGTYAPPDRASSLPEIGGDVLFVARVAGRRDPGPDIAATARPREVRFAGYSWAVKTSSAPVGPGPHIFADDNVWVDPLGKLHLRVAKRDGHWTCAEVVNQRSLGLGTYTFVVSDTAQLSPATVLGLFTWDDSGEFHHREIDIEVGRWGDVDNPNAQFVVQPYTDGNLVRFTLSPGPVVTSFDWTAARVYFRAARPRPGVSGEQDLVREHTFDSGIPPAGDARVHINLWRFGTATTPDDAPEEIVIDDFHFAPKR